jgi:hypothetical protein
MNRLKNNNKGVVLLITIIIVSLASVLLVSYLATVVSEKRRVEHETSAGIVHYIAQAGLEQTFLDLNLEHDGDGSWVNGGAGNTINGVSAAVPACVGNTCGYTDDGQSGSIHSDYQNFYVDVDFPGTDPLGTYTVEIAFVNNTTDTAFLGSRLWVRSTGTESATGDSVSLIQIAKVRMVKNETLGILYDTLDYQDDPPASSAVDNALGESTPNEIRIAGTSLDEDVTIVMSDISGDSGADLTIKGGYNYDFEETTRNPASITSLLRDTTGGDTVVTVSGSGTLVIGGVDIQ